MQVALKWMNQILHFVWENCLAEFDRLVHDVHKMKQYRMFDAKVIASAVRTELQEKFRAGEIEPNDEPRKLTVGELETIPSERTVVVSVHP